MKKTLLLLIAASSFSLAGLSCGVNTVGTACTVDRDCDLGQSCFMTGFPGGLCTRGCTRLGESGTECPSGSVCSATSIAGSSTLFCATPCSDDSQCRGDVYRCRAVSGTDKKACAP